MSRPASGRCKLEQIENFMQAWLACGGHEERIAPTAEPGNGRSSHCLDPSQFLSYLRMGQQGEQAGPANDVAEQGREYDPTDGVPQ